MRTYRGRKKKVPRSSSQSLGFENSLPPISGALAVIATKTFFLETEKATKTKRRRGLVQIEFLRVKKLDSEDMQFFHSDA